MELKPKFLIRADGGAQIGLGHLVRCFALAQMLKEEFSVSFFCKEIPESLRFEIEKDGFPVRVLEKEEQFFSEVDKGIIILLDGYNFDTQYQRKIKDLGAKLVCIDDVCDKHFVCDAIINNIPYFKKEDYSAETFTKIYIGIDYAFLRKEFLNPKWRKVKKDKNTVFLSFGGSDYLNLTHKFCDYLTELDASIQINALIGNSYQYLDTLKKLPGVRISKNLGAYQVANLISVSDVCIVPASSLLNEVSCIGSKTLVGYFVENQIPPYNYFVEENLAIGAGNFQELDFKQFQELFLKTCKSKFLIKNQHKQYRFQQEESLKNIFFSL